MVVGRKEGGGLLPSSSMGTSETLAKKYVCVRLSPEGKDGKFNCLRILFTREDFEALGPSSRRGTFLNWRSRTMYEYIKGGTTITIGENSCNPK